MFRVIGWIVGILILYAIISQPTQAAATTNNLASGLASAGQQVVVFVQSVVGSTTSYTQVHGQPSYVGVETGDGSYP
ncbi:hypothetical protein [Actinomycetospora sp. TBRC 11914]|uniref:hypothetical protein n=1 Tax=Actinomycetospora sp. TBRC 11914 TaxID=2729387 RepID=UPI00145F2F1C|nr:hypothetical protein [Actinomycetospora sp. TBRC 11914]NMO93258.1 hypothetical protein [Actinomycetospora sp. TBRC 11914]